MVDHLTRRSHWVIVPILAAFIVAGFSLIQVQYNDAPGISIMRGLGREFMARGLNSDAAFDEGLPSFSILFLWVLLLMALMLTFSLLKKHTPLIVVSSSLGGTWAYLYLTFSGTFNRVIFLKSSALFWLSTLLLIALLIRGMRKPALGARVSRVP